jgi:hypothetical protein
MILYAPVLCSIYFAACSSESTGRIPSNANIAKLEPHITILRTTMHGDVLY